MPVFTATSTCSLPNRTLEDVSLPVRKVPRAPMKGAMSGKKEPEILTRTTAMAEIMPL